MPVKEVLENLIQHCSTENLVQLFRLKTRTFREINEEVNQFNDDFFTAGLLLGEIKLDNDNELIVYTFKILKELTERSGKKAQYELAKKILKQEQRYTAGFFIFYDENGNFRFSLIYDLPLPNAKREWSNFRRFTYYVTPNKPNKTFRLQFDKADFSTLSAIQKAFSIDAVTDDFYKEFKPNFDKLSANIIGTKNQSLKQDFALLFIIRTIFLGFVQKKLWLNNDEDFIQNFWNEYKLNYNGKNSFYEDWLRPLFFESLNNPPGRKVFNRTTPFSEKTALALQMAPYLNGELFKEKIGVDDQDLSISDKAIEQFITFLFSYNFTIEENTLYDQELELNPEFLGIIFERLVNKENGAVYTPRTEVDFMSRISLVKWLQKTSNVNKKKLYHVFFDKHNDNNELLTDSEKENILSLLKTVTICDPAAGSGAFTVGMLQVLDEIILLLSLPSNENEFERKKDIISRSLYGVEVKAWAVWINQLRLWLSLFIDMPDEFNKSFEPLLPNLEFKIRRGDSLVQKIGSKIFPVESHANLSPQLKRKVTELKKEKSDFFYGRNKQRSDYIRKKENTIFKEIIEEQILEKKRILSVFSSNGVQSEMFDAAKKEELRLQIDEKKKSQIIEEIKTLEDELKTFIDEHPLVWNIEFAEIFYDRNGFDIIIGNPPYVRQEEIVDPEKRVAPKEYKELLRQTIYEEFPAHFFKDKQRSKLKNKIDGKSDLYTFFYVKSLKLLNENGVHTFICSNSWLDVGYGKWLQQFILENSKLHFVIDNQTQRSFSSSDVNTIISVLDAPTKSVKLQDIETHKTKFILFKRSFEEILNTENLLLNEYAETITKDEDFRVYPITVNALKEAGTIYKNENDKKLGKGSYEGDKWGGKYLRAPDIFFTIFDKGKEKFLKLFNFCKIEGYIHDNNTGSSYPKAKFIKTVKNLKCISINSNTNVVIMYGVKKNGNSRLVAPIWFPRTFGERQLIVLNDAGVYGKEFYKILPNSEKSVIPIVAQLNSTLGIFQRELLGLVNLGDGALKFSADDIGLFFIILEIKINLSDVNEFFARPQNDIAIELGFDKNKPLRSQKPKPLPDRKALDDIIFDALDLTKAEREEVYYSVCELVQNRLKKARSV